MSIKKIPMLDVLERYTSTTTGRKNPKGYSVCCPFHDDKHPSAFVYTTNNRFVCFTCGINFSPVDVVMKAKGVSFKDAAEELTNVYQAKRKRPKKPSFTFSIKEQNATEEEIVHWVTFLQGVEQSYQYTTHERVKVAYYKERLLDAYEYDKQTIIEQIKKSYEPATVETFTFTKDVPFTKENAKFLSYKKLKTLYDLKKETITYYCYNYEHCYEVNVYEEEKTLGQFLYYHTKGFFTFVEMALGGQGYEQDKSDTIIK